jgi:hypothetical protein
MTRCASCREPVRHGALLCANCGAPVTAGRGGLPPVVRRVLLGVLLGVCAVVMAVAAWWFLVRPLLARFTPDPVRAGLAEQAGVLKLTAFDGRHAFSQGSGFLVGPEGLSVSNYHVLAGADRVEARLADGRVFDVVRVEGFDVDRDVCAFRIARTWDRDPEPPVGAHTLRLRKSPAARVGERISVIGSPKGFENTVSDGLVSAIRHENGLGYLQFTAPISPGSSGGPLFDAAGRVLGMVELTKKDAQNLNFAIPALELDAYAHRNLGWSVPQLRDTMRLRSEAERAAADSLARAGNCEDAIPRYERALDLDPRNLDLLLRVGFCYRMIGEDEQCAEYMRDYLAQSDKKDPGRAVARRVLARLGEEAPAGE